jgi:glycine betaine/proline transport system permease protein
MVATLALILSATAISLLIGIPVGILNARSRAVSVITRPLLDFMQTVPPFVYLIPALMFFGIGEVPGVIATVVFAMPPAIRLTTLGLQQIPRELIEAGRPLAASLAECSGKSNCPAPPSIMMVAFNQTMHDGLSWVVMPPSSAPRPGKSVMRSLAPVEIGMGFESGWASSFWPCCGPHRPLRMSHSEPQRAPCAPNP